MRLKREYYNKRLLLGKAEYYRADVVYFVATFDKNSDDDDVIVYGRFIEGGLNLAVEIKIIV